MSSSSMKYSAIPLPEAIGSISFIVLEMSSGDDLEKLTFVN